LRILQDGERQAVQAFAPDAKNEQQLFVASAKAEGWEAHPDNIDGSTFLPDGSSYIKMIHQQTAREMFVFAPVRQTDEHGKPQSGVFNAYKSLLVHGQAELGSGIEGEDIVHITSTHYGPMAVMNNLLAVHELRTRVGSFQVVGDNQPATRGPQAHLIEIGKTLDRIDVALQRPALRVGLAAA